MSAAAATPERAERPAQPEPLTGYFPVTRFRVPGKPVPQERQGRRAFVGKDGRAHVSTFQKASTRGYRSDILSALYAELGGVPTTVRYPAEIGLLMTLDVAYPIPPSWTRRRAQAAAAGAPCTAGGDTDNLAKTIADALQGVLFVNDKQISSLIVRKHWGEAGASVMIQSLGRIP